MKRFLLILLISIVSSFTIRAQEEPMDDYNAYTLIVQARLQLFLTNMQELCSHVGTASSAGIVDIRRNFNSLDIRWNTYCNAQQGYIADKEVLLSIVAQYQQVRQITLDSIEHCALRLNAEITLSEAITFLNAKTSEYQALITKCDKLTATEKSAPQLERLQAGEQLMFADITARYQAAKQAITINPSLKNQEADLDNIYLDISAKSAKVQEAKYKPFMERIKDYLLGFAAVAIVLMFVSMIQNKIVATKQMKESLKKLKEQYIKEGQDDIPSI